MLCVSDMAQLLTVEVCATLLTIFHSVNIKLKPTQSRIREQYAGGSHRPSAHFVRIAACGSFTLAAEQLDLPRATVSLAMQQLELRLGVRLLNRTTRRVGLTPEGEALLARASALVADMEDIEQQFRPTGRSIVGRRRVDVPSRIAHLLMAPALPAFLEQ